MDLEFEIVPGQRKNSKLLYVLEEQQFYAINSKSKRSSTYLCYVKDCRSRVSVRNIDNKCFLVLNFVEHNHPPQGEFYNELKIKNKIKEECSKTASLLNSPTSVGNVRAIFSSVCQR